MPIDVVWEAMVALWSAPLQGAWACPQESGEAEESREEEFQLPAARVDIPQMGTVRLRALPKVPASE